MPEFSPYKAYQNIIHRWWMFVLCMVTGGVLGLVVHAFRPTVLEAQAFLAASMNFPTNEYYSQFEEDYAFTIAATHISPLAIANSLAQSLEAKGYNLDPDEFLHAASLERMQSTWALRFKSTDARLATVVVETWSTLAYEKLTYLRDHSLTAQSYYSQLRFLNTCYQFAMLSEKGNPDYPSEYEEMCNSLSADMIHNKQASVSRLFAEEVRLSRGMNPFFVVDIPDSAGTQVYRTAYDRNLMVLAGALSGLVIGLWLVNLEIPGKGRRV